MRRVYNGGLINRNERVLYMKIHDALRHLFLYCDTATLLFRSSPNPLTSNETKMANEFQCPKERMYIRASFSPLFELSSSRSIKINFERARVYM